MIGLGQWSGIGKITQGLRSLPFAGANPLSLLTGGRCDRSLGTLETLEFFLGQQDELAIIGQQHALFTNEERAVAPFGNSTLVPDFRFFGALIPGVLDRRISVSSGSEGVFHAH